LTRQKPTMALAFKRGGRGYMPTLPAPPAQMPAAPQGITEYGLGVWAGFWETEVSGAVNMKRDGERLRYWIRCVDRRNHLWVNGDLEDWRVWKQVVDLTAAIERAEQQFGMGALNKMRLTGALDQAEAAESSIKARRDRRPVEA
jgi:hypothetical protein